MLRTHPEINVLIALNETTAVGAAQAVQQMQRADDLWLAAFDSNIETIDALQTGTVDALIVQNTTVWAISASKAPTSCWPGRGAASKIEHHRHPHHHPGKYVCYG